MAFSLPKNSPLLKKDFTYGVATAAFQIEGATNLDGRCESIWDRFCRTPGKVLNDDHGDIACDHYHRVEQDLDLIQSLGVDAYRFSIAWPRIEPSPDTWNEAGFAFYERIINGLIERGIKPYLTLYHWDLPQYLEEKGGWINRETAYRFAVYAQKVVARFGDRVTAYATFNEPWCSAFLGYRFGNHAPGLQSDRLGFQAAHHLLLAHGLALPALREYAPNAEHGIVLNFTPNYPLTDSKQDQQAASFADEEHSHWFLQPLLTGSYPKSIIEQHPEWVPTQLDEDLVIIARDIDFLGINFYTRQVVSASDQEDYNIISPQVDGSMQLTDIGWEVFPQALTELLQGFKKRYSNLPPIIITENGAADNTSPNENGEVIDSMRVAYYNDHLNALHNAIESGVNISGYFAWSLMDNFEWAEGYSQRFGIVYVDYETQKRTIKHSGYCWQEFLNKRGKD